MEERLLVTGALGCIGSWVVHLLHRRGAGIVATDVSGDRRRWRLLDPELEAVVPLHHLDVTDVDALSRLIADQGATRLVHLAALQVPLARGNPLLGARVNVEGTTAVLEAARRNADLVRGTVFASSAAVYGPATDYPAGPLADDAPTGPATLYGAHKLCDEWLARVYATDWGVRSIGLRPFTVYGPGRDQGVTSSPTLGMLAAAARRPFHIAWGGPAGYGYTEDVASAFIAAALAADDGGPSVTYNLPVETAGMEEVLDAIETAAPGSRIDASSETLPFAVAVDPASTVARLGEIPRTPLREGIAGTIAAFRNAIREGRLDPEPILAAG